MVAKVILNPYSNRWRSQRRWPQAEAALKAAGIPFEVATSQRKGQVVELAEQAVYEGCSPIIAAGGDGTISETVQGLVRAAKTDQDSVGPFGIMPLGSANDFIFNSGMPTDLNKAAHVIAAGRTPRHPLSPIAVVWRSAELERPACSPSRPSTSR